ncbi:hypothetical protein JCM3766R1_005973 [Sporobolomyces carnicolor]
MPETASPVTLPFSVPSGGDSSWIAPYYAEVFGSIQAGSSPYVALLNVLRYLYYPKTESSFRAQVWVLIGLFSLTLLIILLGLGLRLHQGRMFFFHRLDKTVAIPGGSLFPICALTYSALGLAVMIGATQIVEFSSYPHWWQGVRAGWIGPLWLGIFFEVWACYSGWYIRRYGAHFRESTVKTLCAFSIPIVIVLSAWVPPTFLFVRGAREFNEALRVADVVKGTLERWQSTWSPTEGLNLANFMSLFDIGAKMGKALVEYSSNFQIGCLYVATLLTVTLIAYLIGAVLELDHLSKTIHRLKIEHRLGVKARVAVKGEGDDDDDKERGGPSRLSRLVKRATTTIMSSRDVDEELDDEYARGMGKGRRQWILMEWVRTNRILTTACIAALLMAEIGLLFWKGFTKVGYETPSSQFKAELLISGWLNSLMMTLVSLLILFRSLDGSSPLVDRLRRVLPFVPFPPSLERRGNGTSVGSVSTNPGGPPRHYYNSEKTVIVCEERPVFENKIIVEEDEEGEEGSEEDVERTWTEGGGSSSKGYSFNASTVRPLVRVPPRSASLSYPSTSTLSSSSRGEKTISRVPVPTLGSSDRPTTTLRRQGSTFSQASSYSPPPPEYRRESNAHSIELEDDDSAVDKDGGGGGGGGGQGTSKV